MWNIETFLASGGNRTPAVQAITRRYTYRSIPAPPNIKHFILYFSVQGVSVMFVFFILSLFCFCPLVYRFVVTFLGEA
jgi:hypothetical protein